MIKYYEVVSKGRLNARYKNRKWMQKYIDKYLKGTPYLIKTIYV